MVPINLPPLRDRRSDIPLLINHFLDKYSERTGKNISRISPDALSMLMKYPWQGNIRELSNAVQYALIKCRGDLIEPEHLPLEITGKDRSDSFGKVGRKAKLNRRTVQEVLHTTAGNKARAAKMLGVSRTTLYRYIEEKVR